MKEFIETVMTRITSPLFFYYFFAVLMLNWEAFFYLFVSDVSAADRIIYFQNETGSVSLILNPILVAAIYAFLYPWLHYGFLYMTRFPTDLKNTIQARSASELIFKKLQLEMENNKLIAIQEEKEIARSKRVVESEKIEDDKLINQAKQEAEINKIDDEEVRENLKLEIEKLRKEREQFNRNNHANRAPKQDFPNEDHKMILHIVADNHGKIQQDKLTAKLPFNKIKTEHLIEVLIKNKYLSAVQGSPIASNHVFSLASLGKKFLVDEGYFDEKINRVKDQ